MTRGMASLPDDSPFAIGSHTTSGMREPPPNSSHCVTRQHEGVLKFARLKDTPAHKPTRVISNVRFGCPHIYKKSITMHYDKITKSTKNSFVEEVGARTIGASQRVCEL